MRIGILYEGDYDQEPFSILLRRVLKKDPHFVPAQIGIGEILYYKGDYKGALDILDSLPENEQNEKVKLLIADIALASKDYPKAEAILKNVVR